MLYYMYVPVGVVLLGLCTVETVVDVSAQNSEVIEQAIIINFTCTLSYRISSVLSGDGFSSAA